MQMLKGLGPSVVVSKIDFLFLSRIEKRWKNVKRWIFHWAICKDCLVHGRCINRMHYNLQWWQNQSPSYCHNYPQIKSLLCLIATLGGRGRGETGWWTNWWIWGSMGCAGFGTGGLGSGKQITSIGSPVPNTAASSLANWQMSATDVLSQFSHLRPCSSSTSSRFRWVSNAKLGASHFCSVEWSHCGMVETKM